MMDAIVKLKDVRDDVQHYLKQRLSLDQLPFAQIIKNDTLEILEAKAGTGKLKKVVIQGLPSQADVIWRLNWEVDIPGLAPLNRNKPVETVLAILEGNRLNVYLIELKTSLEPKGKPPKSTLAEIKKKFIDSMNRFYFVSTLDHKHDHKNYHAVNIYFTGIVFYNVDNTTPVEEADRESAELYKILKRQKADGLSCMTILGEVKLPVKFILNHDMNRAPEKIIETFNALKS